jgi:hypothetical protein
MVTVQFVLHMYVSGGECWKSPFERGTRMLCLQDMLQFRRKNVLVGDDHHQCALKQHAISSTGEGLQRPTPSGTYPTTDSRERLNSAHGTCLHCVPPSMHLCSHLWHCFILSILSNIDGADTYILLHWLLGALCSNAVLSLKHVQACCVN